MNAKRIALFLAALVPAATSHATNPGLSTIEQPVNLCAESDPARIPLGEVAVESNYHYGRGPVITAPRPSLHGAMEWKSGVEINQNLASVFGIELNDHDLPHAPAVIRLRDYPKPAYSPYTKEQVLAATLHCILRSNRGTPESPIQLEITADSPDDEALAKKYAGTYINSPNRPEEPPVEPTPVPGTRLETDARGITWVVFSGITAKPAAEARPPVMIPFRIGGEIESEPRTWSLLPVWTGGTKTREESLLITGQPYPLFYDRYQPGNGDGPETNAIFAENPPGSLAYFHVKPDEASTRVEFVFPQTHAGNLSATILALVVSVQPTAEHPLTVVLEPHSPAHVSWFEAFRSCPGWETPPRNQAPPAAERIKLSCSFVWDATTHTLRQGAVPAASIERTPDGKFYILSTPDTPEEAELAAAYQRTFDQKWQAGEFEPGDEHLKIPGKGLPLVREYWLAGYRDALLTFRTPGSGENPDRKDPLWDDSSTFAKSRHEGWRAGCRDGAMIAAKILEEERTKLAPKEPAPEPGPDLPAKPGAE